MTTSNRKTHQFGGHWTSDKLEVISQYLSSYTTALKDKPNANSPFKKAYIDGFAGSGYRNVRGEAFGESEQHGLPFPDFSESSSQDFLDGSARKALLTEPRFDNYIFIEKNAQRCAELQQLKKEFPLLANDIMIRQEDANNAIQYLCDKNWDSHRAVLFLDPYGLQVEWTTIEAVASTKAIDLWLLFPLGIGVNRLLTKSGKIPESWRITLNRLLGTSDWQDELYEKQNIPDLFGDQEKLIKVTVETIGRYFNDRLKHVFEGVVDEPGVLRNSVNNPLYLLCFAVGNRNGRDIALRIANHLLRKIR